MLKHRHLFTCVCNCFKNTQKMEDSTFYQI